MADGEKVKPPRLLMMALYAEQWGTLPESGGLLDQPAGMITKMSYLKALWHGLQAYYSTSDTSRWANNNPGVWEIVAEARKRYREWQTAH